MCTQVAGAKEINSGGVGLVFLCDVAPGFFVKLSAPYWFHLVPHSTRVIACGVLMVCAFSLVGCGTTLGAQLAGVSLSSTQSALGETTFLSLAARYDSRWALTMWSSGTGFAGVFGYVTYVFCHLFGETQSVALSLW
ncbi:batten's disease protein Cln3 [Tribonema minus]|uniref:Batten's disease protein Cln3 n=1 Tax=Tribonema minus TaxID=303371 RepID=A0A836CP06_9STRA|nr:batten's disease protein Cln3 [Tribonema minus]